MPQDVINALNDLRAAIDAENARLLAKKLWDLVRGIIPGFPFTMSDDFDGASMAQCQAVGDEVEAYTGTWPAEG